MKKRAVCIEILIWLSVLAVLSIGFGLFYYKTFIKPHLYTIEFTDIDCVTEGSPVRFMGYDVGYVRNLKARNKFIDVQIIITMKNFTIPHGTVARVESYGLGGSKSIELMPPDDNCAVGIVTDTTIRISDVKSKVKSFVEILETVEDYVTGINTSGLSKFLQNFDKNEKNASKAIDEFETFVERIENKRTNRIEKFDNSTQKIIDKADKLNKSVDKINKSIKK